MSPLTFAGNHLWQSTLYAAAAAALAFLLKGQRASVRYRIWLSVSLKFLVPFSLLTLLGSAIGFLAPKSAPAFEFSSPLVQLSEPFGEPAILQPVFQPSVEPPALDWEKSLPFIIGAIWLAGFLAMLALWAVKWLRVRRALNEATALTAGRIYEAFHRTRDAHFARLPKVRLLSTEQAIEPGVVGIWRPALLVPANLGDQLTDAQLVGIVTHELCHVERRDNFAAVLHMFVQAAFWFHPVVWWVGSRLIDERELACDAEVVRLGNDADTYAKGILTVCRHYLRSSPLAAGITSSNLKLRIQEIVSLRRQKFSFAVNLVLVASAFGVIALPVLLGMTRALAPQQQTSANQLAFEVASVKRNSTTDPRSRTSRRFPGGRRTATAVTLHEFFSGAYGVPDYRISGAPDWWDNERYDIEAKAPEGAISTGPLDLAAVRKFQSMEQDLLASRFKLKIHREKRDGPFYALVVAKGGLKLQQPPPDRDCLDFTEFCHGISGGPRFLRGHAMSIAEIADLLGFYLDRPVQDQSGTSGLYDFELHWTPESVRGKPQEDDSSDVARHEPGVIDPFGPDLFTALQEQAGLKLEAKRGPVEIFVIDHIEKLAENEGLTAPAPKATAYAAKPAQTAQSAAPQPAKPQAGTTPQFETASIKPCKSVPANPQGLRGGGGDSLYISTGRIRIECMTALTIIRTAYGYSPASGPAGLMNVDGRNLSMKLDSLYGLGREDGVRVRGGQEWARSELYTIEAVGDPSADANTLRGTMLLALLERRFQLKAHVESEQIPGFQVVIAKGGLTIKPAAEGSCIKPGPGPHGPEDIKQRIEAIRHGGPVVCGNMYGFDGPNVVAAVAGSGVPSVLLGPYLGIPVIDKTGIPNTEHFNYIFEFGPDESTPGPGRPGFLPPADESASIPRGPNIFTAMEEQLGLKLEPTKLPREYVVIDRLERPVPN